MKNLTIFSIIYFILIGFVIMVFARDLLTSSYHADLNFLAFHYSFDISYAVLIVAPLAFYAIVFLLSFYLSNIKTKITLNKIQKDSKKFNEYCADLVLEAKPRYVFKSSAFKNISPFINELINNQPSSNKEILSEAIMVKNSILNGEFSKARLERTSSLYEQNQANLCANSLDEAKFYLKNKTQIDDEISLKAYENMLTNADYKDIKALKIPRASVDCERLIERFAAGNLELSAAELEVLLSNSGFDAKRFLHAAKSLHGLVEATVLQALFCKLANQTEAALRAYWYVLASLAMFDELREALHVSEAANEDFKLVLFLKDHSQHYDLNKLIC